MYIWEQKKVTLDRYKLLKLFRPNISRLYAL